MRICNFYKCSHYAFGISFATKCHIIEIPRYMLTNKIQLEKAIVHEPKSKCKLSNISRKHLKTTNVEIHPKVLIRRVYI